jgi:hypothetical protein
MKSVYALYPHGDDAQRAVNSLRASGVADHDITVMSNTPMEDYEFSHIRAKNRLWYLACGGGVVAFAGITALLTYTSNDWPMNVGNMKPIAWWAFLIPMFEMTMLGAIFTTIASLIITAKLLRRRPKMYDPAVSDGQILVGVENFSGNEKDIERALMVAPYVTPKTI